MTNFFTAEELVANYEKFRKLINNISINNHISKSINDDIKN